MLALQRLLAEELPGPEEIDTFLADHTFPLIEGRSVTFVYRGVADEVNLRHWVFGLPSSQPLRRAGETDLWFLTLDLPERSRIEYKLERVLDGSHEWIMDPLNPRIARDPFGANSVCHTEGYETPDWALPHSDARPGSLHETVVRSQALGGGRKVRLYLPARFRKQRRYPLLVVHDGEDFLRYAVLQTVLDNLIHRLEIQPLIAALIPPGDRRREYSADPRHARFLTEELVPQLQEQWPLIPRPADRALMGASLGAVASLYTAWRHPGFFGKLLLQSGSFVFSDLAPAQGELDPVVRFVNEFREHPGRPVDRMFVSCGIYEALIYHNRSLIPLLQSTGMEVRYVEARDGHNWENWRDRLRVALSWLFPGPLWMVYE
jgi:enterochelin esterase family protein